MTNTDNFDLNNYLMDYQPVALPADQWTAIRSDAEAIIRDLDPRTKVAARTHLSVLVVFLAAVRGSQPASLDLLTKDGIERFRSLREVNGTLDHTTLGQVSRLRTLLRVKETASARPSRHRERTANADPYSDA